MVRFHIESAQTYLDRFQQLSQVARAADETPLDALQGHKDHVILGTQSDGLTANLERGCITHYRNGVSDEGACYRHSTDYCNLPDGKLQVNETMAMMIGPSGARSCVEWTLQVDPSTGTLAILDTEAYQR